MSGFFYKTSFIFLILLTFTVNTNDAKCGSARTRGLLDRSSRVIGGTESRRGSHPWLVSLKIRGSHFCAAAILTDHWLLTAAHCFANLPRNLLHIVEVVTGDFNLRLVDREEQSFRIKSLKVHERYQRSSPMSYDIALLEIRGRIRFGDYSKPVCLPDPGERFPPRTLCVVGGWGRVSERGPHPSVLREVQLDLIEQSRCESILHSLRPGPAMFPVLCAGPEKGGRDACQGDSGGPLLCPGPDGRWVAVGITSWGKGCGRSWSTNTVHSRRGLPGVYTDVSALLKWIKSQIRKSVSRSMCSVADGEINGIEGIVRNPDNPWQSYGNNEFCSWSFRVVESKNILLEILHLDLENDTLGKSDHLTVFLDDLRQIGRYHGHRPPPPILIVGFPSVRVQFVSDVSVTGSGFILRFRGVGKDYAFGDGCGTVVLAQTTGAIRSPSYPQPYSHSAQCHWIVYAPAGHIVKLDFDDFNVEDSESCKYDSLTIFADVNSSNEIVVLCGKSVPPAVLTSGEVMFLQFRTDRTVSARGFSASLSFISEKDLGKTMEADDSRPISSDLSHL